MEDERIVALYWARSETAITETASKYGSYLSSISYNILKNHEDVQECVNDTYHDAWNAIPPHRPAALSTFLGKITRRISIDRWRRLSAAKRGGSELPLALNELENCVSGQGNIENEIERQELVKIFNTFLDTLHTTERRVFLCRYWYLDSIQNISLQFGFSQSKVASMLYRTRAKLRLALEKEGY